MPPKALIALGSNQSSGALDPFDVLHAAREDIHDSGLFVEASSRFYGTPAFPPSSGPDYVNATISVKGGESAGRILSVLHEIEAKFGRTRQSRWSQRVLDLDLLAFGDAVFPDHDTQRHWQGLPLSRQIKEAPNELILPHPRMQDRAFVLVPLAEIAPHWRHPVTGLTVAEMLAALPDAEKVAVAPLSSAQ